VIYTADCDSVARRQSTAHLDPVTDRRPDVNRLWMKLVVTFKFEYRRDTLDHGDGGTRYGEYRCAFTGHNFYFDKLPRVQTIIGVIHLDT
jgi:nicotinamide riboside kinase